MFLAKAYAASSPKSKLKPFSLKRRDLGKQDVLIDIRYCGICHSDIHQARNEWKTSTYPMVPGHEIAGIVKRVGSEVTKFKPGDRAGVGCFVDSCRKCPDCLSQEQQFCIRHTSWTYNGTEQDLKTPTFGGYSSQIVVDQNYVLKIPSGIPLEKAAPLLCAGITTYSPLRRFKVRKGHRVGVIGLGGLGHMGVKLAAAMGGEITVFSTSPEKEKDARRFGAKHFVLTSSPKPLDALANHFDFILDTVSASHDLNLYLNLLKRDGTLCLVGAPEKPEAVSAFSLILKRRILSGSLIGGIRETQEMLNFCARKGIAAEVEIIPARKINEAYERTLKGRVHYRFVIDTQTL